MKVLAGFAALRNPDGSFCPSVPLYKETTKEAADETAGMSWEELERYFDRLVLEQLYKQRAESEGTE